MTYYSNSNQIRELVMQIADEQVEHLRALETMSDVTVYIFFTISFNRYGDYPNVHGLLISC